MSRPDLRRGRPRLSLRSKGILVVGIPMIGLIVAAIAAVGLGSRQLSAEDRVDRSLRIRTDLQNVLTFLLNAETGIRGYILTGQQDYLEPFRQSRQALSVDLTELRDLVANDPTMSYLAEQVIDQAGRQYLTLNDLRTLGLATGATAQARRDALLRDGQGHMNSLRVLLRQMRAQENRLFSAAKAREQRAQFLSYVFIAASMLFGLVGGVAAMIVFTGGVARRMKRLERDASRVGSGEALDPPLGHDEIGRVGRALVETDALLRARDRELHESEERFRTLAESADDIITRSRLSPEPTVEYISPAIERILGYTPEELIADPDAAARLIHPDDSHLVEEFAADPDGMEGALTVRAFRKDGEVVWLEQRTVLLRDPDGTPIAMQSIARDVTDHKRAEEALRESEAQKSLILANMAEGTVVTEPDGTIVSVNAAMARMAGWTDAEVRGRSFTDVYEVRDNEREALPWEDTLVSKAIATRETLASRGYQQTLLTREGRQVPVGLTAAPLLDSDGNLLGGLAVVRDVSYEREVDHLKSSLVSTVSHELRTPLTMIQGFSELLLDRDLSEGRSREALEQIRTASERLSRLIEDLLSVSRIESGRLVARVGPVDLAQVVDEVVAPYREARDIRVGLDGVSKVMADRDQLVQILTNLVSNAVKYSPERADIAIDARAEGRTVQVEVADRGIGMTEEERSRLFEKFFRADRSEVQDVGGTGLGLYITRNLVEMQGGQIWATSEEGKGSTFSFSLPAAQAGDEGAR